MGAFLVLVSSTIRTCFSLKLTTLFFLRKKELSQNLKRKTIYSWRERTTIALSIKEKFIRERCSSTTSLSVEKTRLLEAEDIKVVKTLAATQTNYENSFLGHTRTSWQRNHQEEILHPFHVQSQYGPNCTEKPHQEFVSHSESNQHIPISQMAHLTANIWRAWRRKRQVITYYQRIVLARCNCWAYFIDGCT